MEQKQRGRDRDGREQAIERARHDTRDDERGADGRPGSTGGATGTRSHRLAGCRARVIRETRHAAVSMAAACQAATCTAGTHRLRTRTGQGRRRVCPYRCARLSGGEGTSSPPSCQVSMSPREIERQPRRKTHDGITPCMRRERDSGSFTSPTRTSWPAGHDEPQRFHLRTEESLRRVVVPQGLILRRPRDPRRRFSPAPIAGPYRVLTRMSKCRPTADRGDSGGPPCAVHYMPRESRQTRCLQQYTAPGCAAPEAPHY